MTNVLSHKDRKSTPWKNGGGTTAEVASAPEGTSLSDFAWRVSIAEITQDGPFSEFEGVDRIIVVIEGAGLVLGVDGVEHILETMQPFNFSGDVTTTARLIGGPTRDINIMTRRHLTTAGLAIETITPQTKVAVDAINYEELVVVAASGILTITDFGARLDTLRAPSRPMSEVDPVRTSLTSLDAIHRYGPTSLELNGNGVAVVVRLRYLSIPISHI